MSVCILLTMLTILTAHAASESHCASSPCVHGSCTDTGDSYSCVCDAFYVGHRCCQDYNDCQQNSCVHGTCVDGINGYTCQCSTGWTGTRCDTATNACGPSTCLNGGTCSNVPSGDTCTCAANFTGLHCDSPIGDLTDNYASVATSSNAWNGNPVNAVDNFFDVNHVSPHFCTHSGDTDTTPWWTVTLKNVYPIRHVKIYNRYGQGQRLRNLVVTVDGQLCATYTQANWDNTLINLYCPEGMQGKTIKFQKSDIYLTLCEVQLFGYISKNNMYF